MPTVTSERGRENAPPTTLETDPRSWRLDSAQLLDMIHGTARRAVLDNGLTVLLDHDSATPLVHVGVGYRVGSMDEGFRQTGLAHLFEHLMFGGTKLLPGSYVARMLEAGATTVNAMTSRDTTRYFQTVPAHLLDFTLFAEADRMGNFLDSIDTTALERERKVVLEEKKQTEAAMFGKLHLWLSEGMLSSGHPYRHPVIGYADDIAAFSLDDVRAWYATHYAPSNAVLVVSGGIDPDAVLAMIDWHFGHIPASPRPQRITARVETSLRQSAMRVSERIGVPGIFYQSWTTPSVITSPREHLALTFAADLLAGGRSGVLHRLLVEEGDLASNVSGFLLPGQVTGMFVLNATLKARADRHAGDMIGQAVAAFADTVLPDEGIDLVRGKRLTSTVRALANFERKAGMLMEGELLHSDPAWFRQEAELTAAISESEIRAAARKWLGSDGFRLSVDPIPQYPVVSRAPSTMPTPANATASVIRAPIWQEATLANGARVRISPRPGDASFHMRLSIGGGQAAEPVGMEGVAGLVAATASIGAGPDDAAELANRIARAGLALDMGAGLYSIQMNVGGLRGGLPSAASVVADALIRPRYDTPAFARHLAVTLANAATSLNTPQRCASTAENRALLGHRHRMAAPNPASSALAGLVSYADMQPFHRDLLRPQDTMILIAGDVDVDATVSMLEGALADWAAPSTPALPLRLDLEPMRPGIRLFDTPGKGTVQITMIWRTRPLTNDEHVAFACLGHALAGSYRSRTNLRLREDKGWSYGVSGGVGIFVPMQGPDYGMLQTSVNELHIGDALIELDAIIEGLRSAAPVREEEIESFRQSERQRLAQLNETPMKAVNTMQDMYDHAMVDGSVWIEHRDRVETLDEARIEALVHDLLPAAGETVCTLMGDVVRMRALLEAAGLADRLVEEADV